MKTSSLQSKRRGHHYDSIRATNGEAYIFTLAMFEEGNVPTDNAFLGFQTRAECVDLCTETERLDQGHGQGREGQSEPEAVGRAGRTGEQGAEEPQAEAADYRHDAAQVLPAGESHACHATRHAQGPVPVPRQGAASIKPGVTPKVLSLDSAARVAHDVTLGAPSLSRCPCRSRQVSRLWHCHGVPVVPARVPCVSRKLLRSNCRDSIMGYASRLSPCHRSSADDNLP